MTWQPLSLHFKQTYEGAYRYLDRCGEFLHIAIEQLGFISTEALPTGVKIEKPEHGIKAQMDAKELIVTQDMPDETDNSFLGACIELADLVSRCFTPTAIIKNGFAERYFYPIADQDKLMAATLRYGDKSQIMEAGKAFGMVPISKNINYRFSSGPSHDLNVTLEPVFFEKVALNRFNAPFRATPLQKSRIDKMNLLTERFRKPLTQGLALTIDLVEFNPPENPLVKHFERLNKNIELTKQIFPAS